MPLFAGSIMTLSPAQRPEQVGEVIGPTPHSFSTMRHQPFISSSKNRSYLDRKSHLHRLFPVCCFSRCSRVEINLRIRKNRLDKWFKRALARHLFAVQSSLSKILSFLLQFI